MMFTHYIITRFNIYEKEWSQVDKNGRNIRDSVWMKRRWELFNKYTVPSMGLQHNLNWKWLVLFHKSTPKRLIPDQKMFYKSLLVGDNYQKDLKNYLRQDCKTPWIITTRLDNDDVIAPWFLDSIQNKFKKQYFSFLDFPKGFQLDTNILYKYNEKCNPFLSLIEYVSGELRGVLSVKHGKNVFQNYDVELANSEPSWIQVIHDCNKINKKQTNDTAKIPQWCRRYLHG